MPLHSKGLKMKSKNVYISAVLKSGCGWRRLPRTLFSLFWAMFGLVAVNSIEIKYPSKEHGSDYAMSFPGGNTATSVVEGVGTFLFALYHVAIIIVLINMLIAMMSHSFECIQVLSPTSYRYVTSCPPLLDKHNLPFSQMEKD